MKMPSLSNRAQQSHHSSSATPAAAVGSGADARSAVWTRSNTDDVNLGQLHKFWSELSSAQRRELLRVDKQTLFEQVRKNFYCSRCHGLLVEGFAQIMNGKNRHAGLLAYSNGGSGRHSYENGSGGAVASVNDDTRDPTVHSWGGLAATRDNMLTVLDCFLEGTPLEVLQNVFENARTRERERELLYPDACGGGGRGWMSQSIGNFGGNGRGHGMKETCALHTARLSCEALVDFWAALGEETRRSLLRMKEEDFIERLMFRFDSKRFCRDCRRNVLREFKEMKELKRTRKEPRCTRWFCAADTVFRYEVSDSVVHIDWQDCFAGDVGTVYQRFEWALGTGEGKCDILGFEDVGLSETVIVDGLDLASVSACHVTVRGWKRDGRSTELAAKAHALKGQLCVHRRLIVGDGIVSITKGESIQRFFERAEETEEEEDDDSMDKDGNDFDGEGSRPQKHAKSPELARDFLLDAATVIFKEQVEKAFREGTARQNAHSIFVCLALSLLEERVRVACKEIATLEKQNKLLEEEEDEKREEEERRERRKLKEKEKKLRKKEKLKEKERAKDKNKVEVKSPVIMSSGQVDAMSCASEEEQDCSTITQADGSSHVSDSTSARPSSPDMVDVRPSGDGSDSDSGSGKSQDFISHTSNVAESLSKRDGNGAFMVEKSKSSRRRLQLRKNQVAETSSNGSSHAPGDRVYICSSIRDGSDQRIVNRKGDTAMTEAHLYNGGLHNTKRVDIWGRTAPENQNRHDVHTQCACGSPQNGSRVKIHGQRIVARVGSKDSSSTKGAKREIIAAASASRPASRNVMDVPGTVGGKRVNVENLDASKGKTLGVARIVGQEGVRLQSKRDAETSDVCMQAHMRNATDNLSASSVSQDDVGASQQGSVNGDATSTGFSTVHNATQIDGVPSSPTPGKLAWVSNHVNGNLLAAPSIIRSSAAVCGHASINGSQHPKPLGSRILQSKPRWPNGVAVVPRSNGVAVSGSVTATATTSAQAVGGSAVACVSDEGPSESSVSSSTTEQPSSRLNGSHQPTGIHKVEDSNAGNSKLLVNTHSSSAPQGLSQKVGASARTSLHPVTSSLSTSSEPFEPESMRRQPFIKGAGGPRNGLSSDGKAVLVEANRVRPSLMGMSMTRAMEVPGHGQHLHAENVLVHNGSVLPPGMVVGAPHLHCNGGPQPSFPQGNRLRPMKSIFTSSAEILQMPPCGPVQIPSLHLHPGQQNFGFYPMQGPWGPRPRNGVLPLPQPGGYLISGPGAIGMPMGSLPPMSLPIPASLQPLPPGMAGPGHFQVPLPSGFRESARESTPFLSRYGARSNSGSADTRVVTSAAMQVLPAAQQDGAALLKAGEDAKQDRSVSPGHVDSTKFSTSAPTEPESSVQHGQHLNSESTNVSEKVGSNFSLFHFGGPSPAPAPQALEPDSAVHLSSAKDRKQATLTSTTSEPSVPEICRTRRCVDEHAVGTSVSELCTPGGEYSLFAAAPGKGFGFF